MDTESQVPPSAPEKAPAEKHIVNPIALRQCVVKTGEKVGRVLDISFVRAVVASEGGWFELAEGEPFPLELSLERYQFQAVASLRARGENWVRLSFEKMVPSAKAHLRSFLCPKKIGESILEDWRTDSVRHYHGLNESELWFDTNGGVLFTYLDQSDTEAQFIIRMASSKAVLQVGKIRRRDYMELETMESEMPLIPLSDRDIYGKLGECRDIVTNFRPTAQIEYNLKQRLLKAISDNLYSTSHKVEMAPFRSPKVVSLPTEA